jgi:NAD(P)-dependent dehydrogenase (short-subunit alcohol dehydrogenase family)
MELHPFGVRVLLVQPGAIRSRFGETAQKNAQRLLSDTSLFHPWRGAILARAGASQIGATTEEDFARRCVRQVVSSRTRPIVRLGTLSHRLPLMKSLLPAALLDRVLIRKYGLFQAPGENA